MKSTSYTLLFFLFFSFQYLQAQIIPNGNMDNWTNYELFERLPPFVTTNIYCYVVEADYAVTRVDGVSGSAVRLEATQGVDAIIPGLISLGNLEGDLGGGVPINSTPDSIRVSLRYEIPAGDAGLVAFIFSKDGTVNGVAQYSITGTQNSYEQVTFDVPPMLGVPDSVQFLAFSSDPDVPILGGFLEIDDIILTGTTEEIPNGDFEIWESIEYDEVDNFYSFNPFQAYFGLTPMATETSDAYAGSSAIRIENVETYDFDSDVIDTIGFISSNKFFSENPAFGLNTTPQFISGWYKYAPVENDSATIFLSFTKYNSATEESEIVAEYGFLLGESSSYFPFSFPLTFNEIPDSVNIGIVSGNVVSNDEYIPLGSVLFLDELSFDFINGTKMPVFSDALEIYPNPASEFIMIKMDEKIGQPKSVQLTDVMGRVILFSEMKNLIIGNGLLQIDVNDYPTGMYYYNVETEKSVYTGKVMIQK
ncbi:MAG: T9SS type A sorting domain-containing protein [Saprospiraceae bacterium]